jgi:hypothetical protein
MEDEIAFHIDRDQLGLPGDPAALHRLPNRRPFDIAVRAMAIAAFRRLLLALTVAVLLLAAPFAGTAVVASSPAGGIMPGIGCERCTGHTMPWQAGPKMVPCGLLACAGTAVAIPKSAAIRAPDLVAAEYTIVLASIFTGAAPQPDPFPPRPSALS